MPAAAVCLSPFLDLEGTGESITTRADVDPIATPEVIDVWAKAYLDGADPRAPLANPLYADLHGLPALLIQVGDHEVLLDDSTRLAERAQAAGVQVELEIWPEMIHRWHSYAAVLPEGQQAIEDIGAFLREQIP